MHAIKIVTIPYGRTKGIRKMLRDVCVQCGLGVLDLENVDILGLILAMRSLACCTKFQLTKNYLDGVL